ncbi:unnamed protein product [Diatraea saccharalis]|uniref:Uncharacterized protein n=1 Tax=Diatraea saccharalis TaxID=40085 RepID=A0A9N9R683_9NEOP|nr:unnamed protein product [Diatraea saccharalis]
MRRYNFPGIHNKPAPQNGPLMTDHIELRDLDLELELLKRKREMIEKQQQQYANEQQYNHHQRQYNFNKPSQMFEAQQQQIFSPNQNYSQNFGQSSLQPYNHFDGGQTSLLGKRPNETKWQSHSASKQFSGPNGGSSQKKFSAGPHKRSNLSHDKPTPLMNLQVSNMKQFSQNNTPNQQPQPWAQMPFYASTKYIPPSQRFKSSKAKPTNRDFKPNKVTKLKVNPVNLANKLISYPIPNQKSPKRTSVTSKDASKFVNKVDGSAKSFILRADVVPSQQIAGRLELALGLLLKDIRSKYADNELYKHSFLSNHFLREVKQAIRERIRTVMIGKHVGKVDCIVEEYRKVFPLESDSDIVKVALEAQKAANHNLLAIKIEEKDIPEHYFKENMERLLNTTLDEMFDKLKDFYGCDKETECAALFDVVKKYNDLNKDKESADVQENIEVPVSEQSKGEGEGKREGEIKDETNSKGKGEDEIEENQNDDHAKEDTDENKSKIESKPEEKVAEKNTLKFTRKTKNEIKELDRTLTVYMKRKLAAVLPKLKTNIMKILNANNQYKTTRDVILSKLQDKLSIECRMKAATEQSVPEKPTEATPAVSTPAAATAPPLPYYVKIHGRPALPKKKQMQTFLQQFKPKSIKKHRNMHLLFVGFDNKEDFEKIVAVKETEIGHAQIYIKVSELSEKAVGRTQNESLNVSTVSSDDDVQLVSEDKSGSESINLINSDLDDQINDLLTSIRKDEQLHDQSDTESRIDTVPDDNEGQKVEEDAVKEGCTATDNQPGENDDAKPDENEESKSNEIKNDQGEIETSVNNDGKADEASADVKNNEMDTEESSAKIVNEEADKLGPLKNDVKSSGTATPTRSSARINNATPSRILTRRASRLAQE